MLIEQGRALANMKGGSIERALAFKEKAQHWQIVKDLRDRVLMKQQQIKRDRTLANMKGMEHYRTRMGRA